MNTSKAQKIGEHFVYQWNNTSGDEHAKLYDENVEFTCSLTQRIINATNGKITGNKTLIAYWELLKKKFPESKMNHIKSSWYNNKIVMQLTIPPFSDNAYGIIELNKENKISQLRISHV